MNISSSQYLNKLVTLNLLNSTNLQGLIINIDKLSNLIILYEFNKEQLNKFNFNNIKLININKINFIELLTINVTDEELEFIKVEFLNSLKA